MTLLEKNEMIGPPLNDNSIREAVLNVFNKYGFGPFDLEAMIHFAIREFVVTPFNYINLKGAIRNYIVVNFECRRGSLRSGNELNLRRVVVYYNE